MKWSNIRLVFLREFRDQLRDRRTLFTIAVLPLLLYPLLGLSLLQVAQFFGEHPTHIWVVSVDALPAEPPLIEQQAFAAELCSSTEAELMDLTIELENPELQSEDAIRSAAQRHIEEGKYDAVLLVPGGFAEALAAFRREIAAVREGAVDDGKPIPSPEVITNDANDRSQVAGRRVSRVLESWREAIVEQSLTESRIPLAATRPFQLLATDVAPPDVRRAAVWSKILPFVVLVWALTGAFYPAIDLCAGEKERGTLETLLCSPALRGEIVWGKLLTIMAFSVATSLLNLLSMGMTGTFVITRLTTLGASSVPLELGPPPLAAMGWLLLALIPISALFSALSLAIAAFARSSKEGQYYLMPLLFITLPLMMLSILPAVELNLGTSLIPITGMLLLLQTLVEGRYAAALPYVIPVVAVTSVCCLLAVRWAVNQFNNESVLFRETERWTLGIWFRHLVRDRGLTPTFGEAMLCGVVLLVIWFFASFMSPAAGDWNSLVPVMVISQVALLLTPVLLMTIILTRSPRRTLLLVRPQLITLAAAVALAVALHPLVHAGGQFVQWLYPLSPEILEALKPFQQGLSQAPLWQALLVLALVPAICEELAFRGFILSGLRHSGRKWTAIILSSLFFGLLHGILQQKLTTCAIGVVIGYLAVQSGSLLPCVLFHFTNNALVVLLSRVDGQTIERLPALGWLFQESEEGELTYRLPVYVVAGLVSAGLILWFRHRPYRKYAEEELQDQIDQHKLEASPSGDEQLLTATRPARTS